MTLVHDALRAQSVLDALGNKFEFQTRIDPDKVDDHFHDLTPIWITDDTQMTLFGMEATTELWLGEGPRFSVSEVHKRHLIEWRNTQDGAYRPLKNKTFLGRDPQMWEQVAPGGTCLSSLHRARKGKSMRNQSNGCGTVMKALPFALALLDGRDPAHWAPLVAGIAQMTHGAETTYDTMMLYMTVVADLMSNGGSQYIKHIAGTGNHIDQWKGGWNAQDCLDMACWAVGNAGSFEELAVLSIAHDGDSDSVAAVAGALWALGGNPIGDVGNWIYDHRLKEAKLVTCVADRYDEAITFARSL